METDELWCSCCCTTTNIQEEICPWASWNHGVKPYQDVDFVVTVGKINLGLSDSLMWNKSSLPWKLNSQKVLLKLSLSGSLPPQEYTSIQSIGVDFEKTKHPWHLNFEALSTSKVWHNWMVHCLQPTAVAHVIQWKYALLLTSRLGVKTQTEVNRVVHSSFHHISFICCSAWYDQGCWKGY